MSENKKQNMRLAGKTTGTAKRANTGKPETGLVKHAAKVGMRDYRNTLRRLAK